MSPFNRLHIILLAGFYLPCVLLLIIIRKTRALLVIIPALMLLFITAFLFIPEKDTIFTLQLNPGHTNQDILSFNQIDLDSAKKPYPFKRILFTAQDFSCKEMELKLDVIHSYRKEVSLKLFSGSRLIRFNQFPCIILRDELYTAVFRNPLKVWSLNEPE